MKFYEEPNITLYQGHALDVLKVMPDESVDMVMTSPPYWGLRSYKTEPIVWGDNYCGHEWGRELVKAQAHRAGETNPGKEGYSKDADAWSDKQGQFCLKCHAWRGELGLEPTIELYIEHLLLIFDEVKRVLKKTGCCFVNIDDSYAGGKGQSGCGNPQYQENRTDCTLNKPYHQMGVHGLTRPADGNIGVPAKSLCAIPERFVLGMMDRGWIRRNTIIWHKNNPMPESVKDRFTDDFEYVFFFVKSKRYWFEQQFEPVQYSTIERYRYPNDGGNQKLSYGHDRFVSRINPIIETPGHKDWLIEQGRNKRCVWTIHTEPYPEAHFAPFPEKLCETPILAGCPSMICKKCGKARKKIYETVADKGIKHCTNEKYCSGSEFMSDKSLLRSVFTIEDKGYTDCGCNAGFESGVVLDPFAGSGTTVAVAKKLGRKAIGIELNPDYCKLIVKRLQEIPLAMGL